MRRAFFLPACVLVIAMGAAAGAQDARDAVGAVTAPSGTRALRGAEPAGRPRGLPANQWRYQFYAGRWWYRTVDNRWSYFDGERWSPYVAQRGYDRRPVDPALLRLEAKEGVLGYKKWANIPGGSDLGSLPLSGTQGSLGGSPSGSFTNPGGIPSAINTATGTSTDVGGLNGRGHGFSGGGLRSNLGVGGRR